MLKVVLELKERDDPSVPLGNDHNQSVHKQENIAVQVGKHKVIEGGDGNADTYSPEKSVDGAQTKSATIAANGDNSLEESGDGT